MENNKLYVYTRKNSKVNNRLLNIDLIPKIFYNYEMYKLYTSSDRNTIEFLKIIIIDIKNEFLEKYPEKERTKANIYRFLLFDYQSPYLKKIHFTHFEPNELDEICKIAENILNEQEQKYIEKIKETGIEPYRIEYMLEKQLDLFIEHLLKGHDAMEYGIYFSFKVAKDDQEFKKHMLDDMIRDEIPNNDIIVYMEFEKFTDMVFSYKQSNEILSRSQILPLLYVNTGWKYGKISETTITCKNNLEEFKKNVYKLLEDNKYDLQKFTPELICQIPLDNTKFSTIVIDTDLIFHKKYLKYKQKYLNLKKFIHRVNL